MCVVYYNEQMLNCLLAMCDIFIKQCLKVTQRFFVCTCICLCVCMYACMCVCVCGLPHVPYSFSVDRILSIRDA